MGSKSKNMGPVSIKPIPDMEAPYQLLGGISRSEFMREYWHKKPLLIRNAWPNFVTHFNLAKVRALVAKSQVESRLVEMRKDYLRSRPQDQLKLVHGPIEWLPPAQQNHWTVLLNGINLHDAEARVLLNQFDFLPQARLDDVMLSYATKGGGVGAHVDNYDVFLFQAFGQRLWRVSSQTNLDIFEEAPLKILREFAPTDEWVLSPGDMLYLPPSIAHEGTAIGECMTYSVGFRAPTYQELGEGFLTYLADELEWEGRYEDAELMPTSTPGLLDDSMVNKIWQIVSTQNATRRDFEIYLGEMLTEPKHYVSFVADRESRLETLLSQVTQLGVSFTPGTSMLYRDEFIFINGESCIADASDQPMLHKLIDQQNLSAEQCKLLSSNAIESLFDWLQSGWLTVGQT